MFFKRNTKEPENRPKLIQKGLIQKGLPLLYLGTFTEIEWGWTRAKWGTGWNEVAHDMFSI